MIYFTSDTHFGSQRTLELSKRPFANVGEMDFVLMTNWNKTVTNADNVYILGDVVWSKNPDDWNNLLSQLKGKKYLILGNHDEEVLKIGKSTSIVPQIEHHFELITNYLEIFDPYIQRYIIMCHYPIIAYNKSHTHKYLMFHGHTHNNTMEQQMLYDTIKAIKEGKINSFGNIFNVGCMMPYMKFTPQPATYIYDKGIKYYRGENSENC